MIFNSFLRMMILITPVYLVSFESTKTFTGCRRKSLSPVLVGLHMLRRDSDPYSKQENQKINEMITCKNCNTDLYSAYLLNHTHEICNAINISKALHAPGISARRRNDYNVKLWLEQLKNEPVVDLNAPEDEMETD